MGAMLVDKVLSECKWFDKTVNLHDILVAGTRYCSVFTYKANLAFVKTIRVKQFSLLL